VAREVKRIVDVKRSIARRREWGVGEELQGA